MMIIVYRKQRELKLLLLSYLNTTIGVVISALNDIFTPGAIGHEISRIFYILGSLILFISVFKEYSQTFRKRKDNFLNNNLELSVVVIITPSLIITISLEILIITFCLISAMMSFRIAKKKRKYANAFLGMCLCTVLSALSLTIVESLGFEEMRLFALGMDIIFFTMLFITAIVIFLEQKLITTEADKTIMKDKYSHDLGNILHTISLSYELIKNDDKTNITLPKELDELIQKKIEEASNVVRFIRSL